MAAFHLPCESGEIDAARRLPGAVEIVVHQFAALALAQHPGEPVGGGGKMRGLAAQLGQGRRGFELR
ncbi:MAG: hypothetical protein P8Y53_15135 [Pseudolabrys sp.]